MSPMMTLTEAQAREFVGATSIQRARAYLERDALSHLTQRGFTLRASCEGTRQEPYLVVAHLTPEGGVAQAHCTCPVGAQGKCKHAAATLLRFATSPDDFEHTPDPHEALATRTPAELVAMLTFIMARHPDLESLLALPFPIPNTPRQRPISQEPFRQQALSVFRELGGGAGASSQIAASLDPLHKLAADFLTNEDPQASATICATVTETILEHASELHDDTGAFDRALSKQLHTLLATLTHPQSARSVRSQCLGAILAIATTTINAPIARGEARDAMLTDTNPEDRQELILLLKQQLATRHPNAPLNERPDDWLLVLLEQDQLDDQAYIERCRKLGRHDAAIRRLIELDRIPQAIEQTRQTQEAVFLAMIQEFSARGFAAQVEPLVRERFATSANPQLGRWLEHQLAQQGAYTQTQALILARFLRRPELKTWLELREIAQTYTQDWPLLSPSLFAHLRELDDQPTLTRCLLAEQQHEQAHQALLQAEAKGQLPTAHARNELELEVAYALIPSRPHTAIHLFQRVAERALHQRNAEGLELATTQLLEVKRLYLELHEQPSWLEYIEDLDERFGRLQGLRELWSARGLHP